MGSPPPAGSKNAVLRFRSVNNIVIAPAKTGRESSRRIAVILTAQMNNGMRSSWSPFHRILTIVVIKFREPRIEEIPARCKEKIARSTEGPAWAIFLAKGGYTVHPVPAPFSTVADANRRVSEGGNNQNLILLRRGNAMSGAPSISGRSQLPKPPIIIGITKKKIMRNACAVTIVL